MENELENLLKNKFSSIYEESDRELLETFTLNLATKKMHAIYVEKFGSKPIKKQVHAIVERTNFCQENKTILVQRLLYWLNVQHEMAWNETVGIKRSRDFKKIPKGKIAQICEWPGCKNTINLQRDHKFPYALGGTSDNSNLQYLCKSCNLQKSSSVYSINSWPTDGQ